MTESDRKKLEQQQKRKLGGGCEALDGLIQQIVDKDKNVNCMQKTRIDWDKHVKEEKIEEELDKHRKDGFLAKKRFLDQVSEKEYEAKQAVEKKYRKELLK